MTDKGLDTTNGRAKAAASTGAAEHELAGFRNVLVGVDGSPSGRGVVRSSSRRCCATRWPD